jgi:hypothetical protein
MLKYLDFLLPLVKQAVDHLRLRVTHDEDMASMRSWNAKKLRVISFLFFENLFELIRFLCGVRP